MTGVVAFDAIVAFFPDAVVRVLVRDGATLILWPAGARPWTPSDVFSVIVEKLDPIAPAPHVPGWLRRVLSDGSIRYDRVLA